MVSLLLIRIRTLCCTSPRLGGGRGPSSGPGARALAPGVRRRASATFALPGAQVPFPARITWTITGCTRTGYPARRDGRHIPPYLDSVADVKDPLRTCPGAAAPCRSRAGDAGLRWG